jgi:uncharacterized coiled-coil DUF342 family protein
MSTELISLRSQLSEANEQIRQLETAKTNLNATLNTTRSKLDQYMGEIRELTVR